MASFDKQEGMSLLDPSIQKFPIRRLAPSLDRFIKVLGAALDRLHQHKTYIIRYDKREDWDNLDRELINATRTMQQIKANIREIDKTRRQVATDDLNKFDEKIGDIKMSACVDVEEFVKFSSDLVALIQQQKKEKEVAEKLCESDNSVSESKSLGDNVWKDPGSTAPGTMHMQLQPLPENSDVLESWETLQESLEELNSLVHHFAAAVDTQQESVDRIEENIEKASSSVWEGVKELGKAAKYKAVLVPVAGALLGAVVAGPIGLLAGAKIGGLAVLGGGVAGAASGKVLQNRQEKIVEVEMANLSARRYSDDGTCVQDNNRNVSRRNSEPNLSNLNT